MFTRSFAIAGWSLLALALLPGTLLAQRRPTPAQLKSEVLREVESMQKLSQEMVDMVFSFSELGFQEKWTSDYLTGILQREGFSVERGCAGMPTCYVATWGSGAPVIGIMGDIDGLPETSQTPGLPYREPLIPGGPGHGEGHNSTPAVDVVAAIATRRVMERHRIPGTLKLIPGVAEELLASRTFMVMAGLFEGMDAMLSTHVGNGMATEWGTRGSAIVSTQYNFHGTSAHGAGAPWAGRSALDAVMLMDVGWNFRREHLRLHQRSHSVVSNGGSQPNVVPSEASIWYFFREMDYPHVRALHLLGDTMATAAGLMTSTQWDQRLIGSSWEQTYNRPLAEALHANILAVGMPAWTEADQSFARAAQRMMGSEPRGLNTEVERELREGQPEMGAASDDIGDVSWNVPTIRLRFPANIPGMTGHHWSSGIAMATPIAHKGANYGSRVLAMTAVDLLTNADLLTRAKAYFRDVQTKGTRWESLIPRGTAPAIHLNEERMARYRPLLEKLRYDPARYATYLEQLGIPYPTLERSPAVPSGAAAPPRN